MSTAAAPAFNPSTAHTRLNSLKHGATSKQLFIPGEDPEAFLSMLQENFRYYTQAERSLQRALQNVLAFHKDNVRTRQWQQLHELRPQKFEIQRERFELAKAREARLAAKSQKTKTSVANKADSEIRFAKNAFSSPQKSAPDAPQTTSTPQTPEEIIT
jgi:hypothetical protein